jgi:hypothetical protein
MWEEQWARVQRGFEEFRTIEEGRLHDEESDHYVDTVFHFFQDCYHLKDWLKNDPTSASHAGQVEVEITNSKALSLCADLANATKHLVLTKSARTGDPKTSFGPKHYKVGLTVGGATTIAANFEVRSGGSSWDAYNIAEAAMDDDTVPSGSSAHPRKHIAR